MENQEEIVYWNWDTTADLKRLIVRKIKNEKST